jgi:hypothetical protein
MPSQDLSGVCITVCGVRANMDKCLTIGLDKGGCPPLIQIWVRWFNASFSGSPYQENPDGSMPDHTEGCKGNLPGWTQIQNLRILGPLDGISGSASCWPPFVSFCPSHCSLWVALTRLSGVALEPWALAGPRQSWDPFCIRLQCPVLS